MRARGTGAITRRSDGRWQVAIRRRSGHREFHYLPRTACREDAEQLLDSLLAAADVGLTPDSPLSSFLQRWLVEKEGTIRASTYRHYSMICTQHLIPGLGRVKLNELTPTLVTEYLRNGTHSTRIGAKRGTRLAPATVRHHLIALRHALNTAEAWRLIDWNPARLVKGPKVEAYQGRALTVPEITRFLESTAHDPLYPLWRLALSTAMRQGEILGLTWSLVDLESGTVRIERQLQRSPASATGWVFVPPKTEESRRTVYLQVPTVAALRVHKARWLEQRMAMGIGSGDGERAKKDDGLVFVSPTGRPIDGTWLIKQLRSALAAAGLPRIRFHDLRDSAITWAIAAGADLETIKRMAGHSSIKTTSDTYGHLVERRQRELAERMEATLSAEREGGVG